MAYKEGTLFLIVFNLVGASAAPMDLAVKPLITGLIAMESVKCLAPQSSVLPCTPDVSFHDIFENPGIMSAAVLNVTWNQLQPLGPIPFSVDTSSIDHALSEVRSYNIVSPTRPVRLILRIESAGAAPDWVKNLSGSPIKVAYRPNGLPMTIPRFWTKEYNQVWRDLLNDLARKYDDNPLIAQISNTSCSHQTDEPYVSPTDPKAIIAMFDAGYSNDVLFSCLMRSAHDYDSWRRTRVDFAQNPFEELSIVSTNTGSTGVYGPLDDGKTLAIVQNFLNVVGNRAVISNHNLTYPIFGNNASLFSLMSALRVPLQFQTAAPGSMMKDWNGTIQQGVSLGASAIELWSSVAFQGALVLDGWNCISASGSSTCNERTSSVLQSWSSALTDNLLTRGLPRQ